MVQISASLLAADFARLGEEVRRAEAAGVDSFHFDLMDGHYAPNLALAPEHLRALRGYTRLPFMVHLELSNPDQVLARFDGLQADLIVVQWDTLMDPLQTFARIRGRGCRVGLALNPRDEPGLAERLLCDLDLLLLLGVQPGFGGQSMQDGTREKIARARRLTDRCGRAMTIAVDGGVKPDNVPGLVEAGADCLIMGTALFQSADMGGTVRRIRESIAG